MASKAHSKGILRPMACLTAAILSGMAASVLARWPGDPAVNLPICTERYEQWVGYIASDGSGGAIIPWSDHRYYPGLDIYAQRVDAEGIVRWDSDGVSICSAIWPQEGPLIVPGQSGGGVIAWTDYRHGYYGDVYAQRVDSLGTGQWEPDGVPVCTTATDQRLWDMVPDGSGGAILVWRDWSFDPLGFDIRAQRIDGDGSLLWAQEGVPLCTAAREQWHPVAVPDGSGGAIVAWQDWRRVYESDIYAQRVSSGGLVEWAVQGVPLCTAANDQKGPAISSDSAGGAIVVWTDYRSIGANVYAQRVDSAGAICWTQDGLLVSPGVASCITSDGTGGGIIAWDCSETEVRGQRVDGEGQFRWDPAGVLICASSSYHNKVIISDGRGGAVITWRRPLEGQYNNFDIYAQRVDSTGNLLWQEQGVAVSTRRKGFPYPQALPDGSGGAILAWSDGWWGGDDIYAQRVYADGSLTETGGLVTGGGWIPGGPSGAVNKRTFGFNAHSEDGAVFGQLQFNDHGIGLRVHSDTVYTLVIQPGDTVASFSGDCRVDGVSGYSFNCEVMDRGEPGQGMDWFSIEVHDEGGNPCYSAADFLGGGNIQIHKEGDDRFDEDLCDTDLDTDSEPNLPREVCEEAAGSHSCGPAPLQLS